MADRLIKDEVLCMDQLASATVGTPISVSGFRHIILQFSTTDSANLTIQFQGSASKTAPTFVSTPAKDSHWDYTAVIDLEDSKVIEGDTGIALSASDDLRLLMVNTDALSWFNADLSTYVAGKVTLKVVGFSNA